MNIQDSLEMWQRKTCHHSGHWIVMHSAYCTMPSWKGHQARAEIYQDLDGLEPTATMPVGLMINYRNARMTDTVKQVPRCQMTATPVPGVNTKCQCQDQTPGSLGLLGPGIKAS